MKRTFLALAFACLASIASAQTATRATLSTGVNAQITSNGKGAITGPVLNSLLNLFINNMGVLGDPSNPFTGAFTISGSAGGAVPANTIGTAGNYFDDVDSGNIWGPYAAGAWPATPAYTGGGSPTAFSPTLPFQTVGNLAAAQAPLSQRFGHVYNVRDDGTATGNGVAEIVNVTCVATNATITVAVNGVNSITPFTSADIGKAVDIPGCGGHSIAAGVPSISGGGSGYVFGEVITIAGGTALSHPARFIVLATNGTNLTQAGAITTIALYDGGDYSTFPSGTISQASSTLSGTGATFTLPTAAFTALTATITAVPSSTQITLSTPATVSQTAIKQRVIYGTDDTAAFNAGINSLLQRGAPGGTLYLSNPPNQCYVITSPVFLPTSAVWPLADNVFMVGDGPSSKICAITPTAEINVGNSTGFSRGARLSNFSIDGGQIATHDLEITAGVQTRVDHMWFLTSAPGGSTVKISSGEDFLTDSFFFNDNAFFSGVAYLPSFNLDVESADSNYDNNVLFNASTAQIFDNAADNHYVANHGYGFPAGYVAPYNFIANGASTWSANSADTATAAGFFITGYGAQLVGNHAQSGIGSTPVGFQIYSGVQNAIVTNNWSDLNTVTTATQMLGTTSGGSPLAGVGTVVAFNTGSTSTKDIFSYLGPLVSGFPLGANSHHGASILGYLGNYGSIQGAGTFALGDSANDQFTTCRFYRAGGNNGFSGDSQVSDVVFRGSSTTTANLVSCNPGGHSQTNQIRLRTDIKASESIDIKLNAFCSTGDFLYATLSTGLQQVTQTAAGVLFQTSSTTSATPPAFTVTRVTAGATSGSWTPAIVLDTTNGGAFLTMTGTCTGSKTIYTTADVHIVETGSGTN